MLVLLLKYHFALLYMLSGGLHIIADVAGSRNQDNWSEDMFETYDWLINE